MSGRPVRLETIADMSMESRPGTGAMVLAVVGSLPVVAGAAQRREDPMPVQDGRIGIVTRGGMPPEQMVMVDADFARRVMMANVVEVGLRQGNMDQARDQQADPDPSGNAGCADPKPHGLTSIVVDEPAHILDERDS